MTKTLRAIFDREFLHPVNPVDLKPNTWYMVTVECEEEKPGGKKAYPLPESLKLAADMGVMALSTRHSWYAYGRQDS